MQESFATENRDMDAGGGPSSLEALRDFCRAAASASDAAAVATLATSLRAGVSCAHVEQDLADATIDGLRRRFGACDLRTLLERRAEWGDVVARAFAIVEDLAAPGAARALWAHLARALAVACPVTDVVALGPVHCAVFDVDHGAPIAAPEGADTVIVSIRSGGAQVAVAEAPVFREMTLGAALRARPGRLAAKLLGAHAKPRPLSVAVGLGAAALSQTRAALQLARGGARKARLHGLIRNIADAALRRLDASLFEAGAPSARVTELASTVAIPTFSASPAHAGAAALVPVLMYHSVAPDGPAALRRFRTTPEEFDRQLRILQDLNCHAIGSAELEQAYASGRSLPGRPVLITFDDGYVDFAEYAFPLLQKRGFTAEVFIVTDLVGRDSSWDRRFGATAPLMDWNVIRDLHGRGIRFGSHLATHTPATHLTSAQLLGEAARSRLTLEKALGAPARSLAMPFGLYDDRVTPILEWAGYGIGFAVTKGLASPAQPRLRLSRLEVVGGLAPEAFRSLLPWR